MYCGRLGAYDRFSNPVWMIVSNPEQFRAALPNDPADTAKTATPGSGAKFSTVKILSSYLKHRS